LLTQVNTIYMKYVCSICGYVYDDEQQKVPFSKLPEDWKCPLCGAAKSDFVPQQEESASQVIEKVAETTVSEVHTDMQNLSPGQMSALCSNLARGCEKQYKAEESSLFTQLADYFKSITPVVDDATVQSVAQRLKEEIDYYPEMQAAAKAVGDRGAQRVCIWGEKVTRMLSSLVNRYLKEGEQMLSETDIWICTVCGFVYVGEKAPKLCPVCKVSSWKFEKVDGR